MLNKSKRSPQVNQAAPIVGAAAALPSADHPIYEHLPIESVHILQDNGIIRTSNVFDALSALKGAAAISPEISSQVGEAVSELFVHIRDHNRRSAELAVTTYFLVGTVLNEMAQKILRKADYMVWVRTTFGRQHHLEALRQARKIARLGKDILVLAYLGKNRCLELYYMIRQIKDEVPEDQRENLEQNIMGLATRYWRQDLENQSDLESEDAGDIRLTMDSIITIYRLKVVGIDETICSFDQAKMIAAYRGLAIEPSQAKAIAKHLAPIDLVEGKKKAFDDYVMSRMTFPHEDTARPMSIRQLLASFALWKHKRGGEITAESLGASYLDLRNNPHTQEAIRETYSTIKTLARIGGITLQG